MSSFVCNECGAMILDSEDGYVTECEHWPLEPRTIHPNPKQTNSESCDFPECECPTNGFEKLCKIELE